MNNMQEMHKDGLSSSQWFLLVVSFCLGLVSVFAVNRLILSDSASVNVVQAAVSAPVENPLY